MAIKNRFSLTNAKPGANANAFASAISGLILNGVAVAGKLVLGTVYKITTPDALADLGIDAAYDETNKVLVYYHLKEFFRMAENGIELYFMVVAQTVTPADALEDTTNIYAHKLLLESEGKVRQLGIAYNPVDASYVETITDGFNTDVRAAIPKAKLLRQWAMERNMPVEVVLEGRKYSGNSATCLDLRAIVVSSEAVDYEGVSLVIGQDYAFAEALTGNLRKYHAAVGTFLGTIAGIEEQQDAGEVETLDITDTDKNVFVVCGLSNHTTITASESQLDQLDDKGYIFPIKYISVSGYRWNGDHVCARIIIDTDGVMNEHKLAYSRCINSARRALYATLIPKVRTTYMVEESTGKLPLATIKYFEAIGDEALTKLGCLSGAKTTVNPLSDLLTPPRQLNATFEIVPFGTVDKINGTISLQNQL